MENYQCVECGKSYSKDNLPEDFICKEISCPGEGLMGLIVPKNTSNSNEYPYEIGLTLFLLDASTGADIAFADTYHITHHKLISTLVATSIFKARNCSYYDRNYVCILIFDKTPKILFVKSLRQIFSDFGSVQILATYLFGSMQEMAFVPLKLGKEKSCMAHTLEIAHQLYHNFLREEMKLSIAYSPIMHTFFSPLLSRCIDATAFRCLLYTSDKSLEKLEREILQNPFKADEIDLLSIVCIGKEESPNSQKLKILTSKCPVHGTEQFFMLDSPQKISKIQMHGLFAVVEQVPGFCPDCYK